jgi:gliding motility-associated-like protein
MKHLYPFALLLILATPLQAKHIIGGVLSYECLGNGKYHFVMKMYRDCSDPTGAGFDSFAAFSIFKGNDPDPIETLHLSLTQNPISIDPQSDPCQQVPPSVCVQEGIYEFDYQFTDWPSTESYTISYQRCCRNATVTNIYTPGDVGATFTVEITPASQAVCNNSPVFNTLPPVAICVNEPLVFDHSAFDPDGDQLVYELCSPLIGGGQGGPGPCSDVTPDPACPPPYETVDFRPPFSAFSPLGGNPAVTINTITGMLTGTPAVNGQFVVAVCVKEFRNGQLLSNIIRDFQFNVVSCEPAVDAELSAANLEIENGLYLINTCNALTIPIDNESTQDDDIENWRWEFFVGDSTWVFETWDVTVDFPASGNYEGRLMLNPDGGCGDTANIHIEIFPELEANFSYTYDTCVAGPVSFINESKIYGTGQIVDFQWYLGNGVVDTIQNNPVHLYDEPGIVPVSLEVTDEHGCMDDTVRAVVYKPVPALILVRPNDTLTCPPAKVLFTNLSSPIDETYDIAWDFGDGESDDEISPTHTYNSPGIYDVRLEITSPIGCYVDTIFKSLVQVFDPPVAHFTFDPLKASNLAPTVNFFDSSLHAVHWDWYVNGKLVSQKADFTYVFPDTGQQEVMLIITHPEKCQDTISHVVDVEPKVTFFIPNAFTPNEDTVNDLFQGKGITRGITNFKMEVWDRWGQQIFETTDITQPWNGRVRNTDRFAQAGVYVCLVSYTEPRGKPFEYKGFITLIP